MLRVGSWLNVLGYVRDSTPQFSAQPSSQESSQTSTVSLTARVVPRPVYVEAVIVFTAGAVELGEYERILHNLLDVERRIRLTG